MLQNKQGKKVLIGMSGGVDSSVAALLLINAKYQTSGVTLRLYDGEENGCNDKTCCSLSDVEDARSVCDRLGIRHYVFNFKEQFNKAVIEKFIKEYRLGHTPNPCIDCNRFIKFSEMQKRAELLDMDLIATGHYARIVKSGDRYFLTRPKDLSKDQTYVLYVLSQAQLAKTLMPLGELTKNEVREIALSNGFVNAKKPDSQDICFVPDGKYAQFIVNREGKPLTPGNFVDLHGNVMCPHSGFENYTIGQRKGLGVGFGRPVYVVGKIKDTAEVVLGDNGALYTTRVRVKDVNFSAFDRLDTSLKCKGKLRYRQAEEPCTIHPVDENTVIAEFDKPQRAVTAGQAAVFYDGDTLLGGGTIVI